MLNFDKTDLKDNVLVIQNDDGSITCIPQKNCTIEEQAMFDEFREKFPNGKPISPPPVVEPQPSMEDYLLDLDYRLSKIELGL